MLKFESSNRQGNNLYIDNIFVYKGYQQPVGIVKLNNQLKIYPNPASEIIHLEFMGNLSTNCFAQIYNSLGQKVLQFGVNKKKTDVSINKLDKGNYYILFNNQHDIYRKSFIIW